MNRGCPFNVVDGKVRKCSSDACELYVDTYGMCTFRLIGEVLGSIARRFEDKRDGSRGTMSNVQDDSGE